jgi:GNAT superfamily N-acetyltransferase
MAPPLEYQFERMIVDAWPASEQIDLEGWLLRSSGGPTHRGNSVATLIADASGSLVERIERAEHWYGARRRSPMFQIGPCVAPADLDATLDARGYRKEGKAIVAVAPAALVARTSAAANGAVEVQPRAGADWLGLAAGASRHASSQDVFLGFLARLGNRCRFALARSASGSPAAVGLGIESGPYLGIYAMFTLPNFRRQGAARSLLRALGEQARAEGRRELYLLVEAGNIAARTLYAQYGFRDFYSYHYRVCG